MTDLETSAYHEAGHAFMAAYVGTRVRSVTIEPDWDDGPERYADIRVGWPLNQFDRRQLHEKQVLVALATCRRSRRKKKPLHCRHMNNPWR